MKAVEFESKIRINVPNPYILVPKRHAETLKGGWRKPMPVLVQVNDKPETPWRINMMPKGDGSFYLYLHGTLREASGTRVGDRVQVRLRFDEDYLGGPAHPMPSWFEVPLSKNQKAKAAWDTLPPSRKKEILRYFSWLKSDEARQRNVDRAITVLSGNPGRFMARDWKNNR
jgi:hypothetical protein